MEQNKLFYNVCNDLWAFATSLADMFATDTIHLVL